MSRPSKKGGVPLRWLDYSAVGKRLDGTRFIAFKVPLKQSLNQHLPGADAFGPWELLDAVDKESQELGLIIDLTFTKRYYSLQDIPESLLVVKIFTAGHEVPSDATILSFKRAVRSFLRDNVENDKLIGVHCTHGLNRTGYLVCRYLIDVDGMDPKEAVELFNSCRGHAVERQNYLDDLRSGPKRSNTGMEKAEQEPMRGLASQRPSSTPSDSDGREDGRSHGTEPRNHSRPFPSRGTHQRSHHHHHPRNGLPSSPVGAPLFPRQWTPPHADGQWRRPLHSEDSSSRYAPPAERRSRYPHPEDSRSSYAPPEGRSRYPPPEERSRYPPPEERSRYPPPPERSRYPPPEERSRYPPPPERSGYPPPEERSRYPPPEERSRYPPPEERSRYPPPPERSRYPPPEERSRYPPPPERSGYPPPEERSRYPPPPERSRYPPPEERSRYPPPPERSRYPPPEDRSRGPPPPEDRRRGAPPEDRSRGAPPEDKRRSAPPPEDRKRGPPPLPRYSPRWTKESVG